jgi:imidazolonepropionase-like amidohydrolase
MLRVASERVSAQPSDALDAELALVPERLRPARREAIARVAAVGSAQGSAAARAWEAKRRFVAAANQAGGTIGVASGAGKNGWPVPGLSVHHELALLVAAGLTPAEAIRAATMGAAATLGSSRTLGQVQPGAAADLLIVEGDPLADITALRKITHVLRAGEVLDPKALLAQARRAGGRGR